MPPMLTEVTTTGLSKMRVSVALFIFSSPETNVGGMTSVTRIVTILPGDTLKTGPRLLLDVSFTVCAVAVM